MGALYHKTYRLRPSNRFDQLVQKEFLDSLFAQKEYIEFFFTKKYNKEHGMRAFLNYAFLPVKDFKDNPENGAMSYLEDRLRSINHRAITKREDLMRDMIIYEITPNPSELQQILVDQLPRLRRMLAEYNVDMGFETRQEADTQDLIERKKEIEKAKARIRDLFGPSLVNYSGEIFFRQEKDNKPVLNKPVEMTASLQRLIYEMVLGTEGYSAWDESTKTMEANNDLFHFFRDKKTGKVRFYSGDIDMVMGHENFHRLQTFFSQDMPIGLRDAPGEYSLTGRTTAEGTATVLEDYFLDWMGRNRRRFGLSQDDIKIASLYSHEHSGNRLIRLYRSLCKREMCTIEGKTEYDADLKVANISKIPVLIDDWYLDSESVPETLYFAFYIFGQKYVRGTLGELEKREKQRLGTIRKARNFLKRNEPLVIQGLLTGNWGWSTHKEFFLKHYWPKARKYCDKV